MSSSSLISLIFGYCMLTRCIMPCRRKCGQLKSHFEKFEKWKIQTCLVQVSVRRSRTLTKGNRSRKQNMQMLQKLICCTWHCHIDRMSRYLIFGYGKFIISGTNASREAYLEMQLLGQGFCWTFPLKNVWRMSGDQMWFLF